jgi:hypothetical protein
MATVTYKLTFETEVTLQNPPEEEVPDHILVANWRAQQNPLILLKAEVKSITGEIHLEE